MTRKTKENTNCMKVDYLKISDDGFFTVNRIAEWRLFVGKCCRKICENTVNKVDPKYGVSYFLSPTLVKEVVGDAVIGMSKIVNKSPNPVSEPNAFKIAAYLGYWFLRHKPICILYPDTVDLDKIETVPGCKTDAKSLSWQLKYINEAVAANIVTTYIFNFQNQICNGRECKRIKGKNVVNGEVVFGFDDFVHQRKIMLQKLTYYFAYRAVAPKVIEHMLEGYAFHPAWGLTGAHWKTSVEVNLYEE